MKKISILLVSAVICLSACDFLEDKNATRIPSMSDTESVLESSIEGVMWAFTGAHGINGDPNEYFGYASGLVHWGTTSSKSTYDGNAQCSAALKFTQYSSGKVNGYAYQIINRPIALANQLIDQLESSPVDQAYKTEIEAEARFYRAVALFQIVRFWGDTPIRIVPDNATTANNSPRMPYYKVFEQIVEDLEFAEKNMRTPERAKEIKPEIPRVHKYAATAYLSSVYTHIGSLLASPDDNFWNPDKPGRSPDFSALDIEDAEDAYEKALAYAEKLIPGSSVHDPGCPYRLLTKFADNFTWDKTFTRDGYSAYMHPEQVFIIPVTPGTSIGWDYWALQVIPPYPAGTSYTMDNSSYGMVRPERWVFQKWCETYPGEMNDAQSLYRTSSDPRLDATFYHTSMEYCNGSGTLTIYPEYTSVSSRKSSYPYFKKETGKDFSNAGYSTDQIVMRFAEVYFNAIEAAAYLDMDALAADYMDVIHARARHSVPDGAADSLQPTWDGVTFASKDEKMTRIFWERIFEFCGERYQEYYNTHRHGATWLANNIAKEKNLFLERDTEVNSKFYPKEFKYEEDPKELRKALLAAFPVEEITYNAAISDEDQNDYWYGL